MLQSTEQHLRRHERILVIVVEGAVGVHADRADAADSVRLAALGPNAILTLATILTVGFVGLRLDFVPLWDGWAYAECAVDVVTNRFALYFLRCYGHPAYVYSGILATFQLIEVGNPVLLFLVNAGVLAAATVGFHRLMRRLFPGDDHCIDVALLTAAFLLQPAFLASVLQPALDLPVLAGTVWCAVLLIERRWFWCAVVGTAMAFSKETGVLLYGVLLACYVGWVLARTPGTCGARLRAILPVWLTVAPLAAYAGYVATFRFFRPGQAPVWGAPTGRPLLAELVTVRVGDELVSYLGLLFVLNFAWLPSAWIATDTGVGALRLLRRRPTRTVPGADRGAIGFLTLAAVVALIALTRFITYSNVRYLMAGTALLLAVAYVALVRLGAAPAVRRIALGVYAVALAVSAVRTVDPVSRAVWGTFPFGSHRMLDMTSITGECCGAGRDQLVYSLEFTRFHDLTDSVLVAMMRDTATVLALPSRMHYHAVGRVDTTTWRRTLRREGAFEATVMAGPVMLTLDTLPRSVIYIDMPNAKDPMTLGLLSRLYSIGPAQRFAVDGYALSAYPLTLKNGDRSLP